MTTFMLCTQTKIQAHLFISFSPCFSNQVALIGPIRLLNGFADFAERYQDFLFDLNSNGLPGNELLIRFIQAEPGFI